MTFVGLGASGLLYAAGARWLRSATAAIVASVPPSWREHFADDYEAAVAFRARDAVLSAATLRALALWPLPVFVLLDLLDVVLGVQLGAAAAYAAAVTADERRRLREQHADWYASPPQALPPNRRLRWSYEGARFTIWLGFIAGACFAARILVDAVR